MEKLVYETVPISRIHDIQYLWEKLNKQHGERSRHFQEYYAGYTFEKRIEKLFHNGHSEFRVEIIRSPERNGAVGYCLCSLTPAGEGEIDSIYIESEYRNFKTADILMRHALQWMESHGVISKKILVAVGNEEVLPFYEWYHFYPRTLVLDEIKHD